MALARRLIGEMAPTLEVDGEMHADSALSEKIRLKAFPDSTLKGPANLLITPNLDTGNITYNMLKMTGSHGVAMGPVLLGAARPVHVLTTSATVRRTVNITALAVVAPPTADEPIDKKRPQRRNKNHTDLNKQ